MQHSHNRVRISVVTTQEQLMHAFLVRSICFMDGESLKLPQAFDGNDFQATHIVAYDGDEPVGATRIRWFRDFAKIERTAFREGYRDARILKRLSFFVFGHVARKGYTKLLTHASPKYAPLWQRVLGFRIVSGKEPMVSPEYGDYVEMIRELEVPENAISLDTDLGVLGRVEGEWDVPTWLG